MSTAVAVKVSRESLSAIASEAGRKFNREDIENWLVEHGGGYFLRDETSTFDCSLMTDSVFFAIYEFKYPNDDTALFRPVIKC